MVMQMKGRGLPTLVQFVCIKHLRRIKYAVAHAQCLRPKVEADDRKFKMQESFDKTTDMYMDIRYQHKICTLNVYFCLEAMIDNVLTRLWHKFFTERRRTMAYA